MVNLKGIEKYFDIEDIKSKFKELDIDITDDKGNYRSFYDVLKDLSEKWDDMTDKEQGLVYEKMLNQEVVDINKTVKSLNKLIEDSF